MNKQILAKCPECGKVLRYTEGMVSIFCTNCKTYSKTKDMEKPDTKTL